MKKRIVSVALMLMLGLCGALFFIPIGAVSSQAATITRYQIPGGTPIGNTSEFIYYDDIEIDSFFLNPSMPVYGAINCGVMSGVNTIAWYNKELTNLIPGHTAGRYIGSSWSWTKRNQAIEDLCDEMDTLMGGGGSSGVTIIGYLGGMISYAGGKGYNIGMTNVRASNNSLSSSFKTAIQAGGLVALFLDTFNLTGSVGVLHYNGYDYIDLTHYAGCHVMTAFGYKEISYLDEYGVTFRQDMYARVQTGTGDIGWIRINDYCTLDAAWVTHIN